MAVIDQIVTNNYALYNGDSLEVMKSMPEGKIHHCVYSPPFGGLYHYSSDDRDLSNSKDYAQFFEHYDYFLDELKRIMMPGRIVAVHTMEYPDSNSGTDTVKAFPDDIVRAHKAKGFDYCGRRTLWKEPLRVRNKTMAKNLMHKNLCEDSTRSAHALPDYLLIFRKKGANPVPVEHPTGLTEFIGAGSVPHGLLRYRGYAGSQLENKYSHWVWRQYASSVWMDIRYERMLPFQPEKDRYEEEKHVHPLQLDVIERCVILFSNRGETVFTPFMGIGSEVYGAVWNERKGIGVELKPSYYSQAVRNLARVESDRDANQPQQVIHFDEPEEDFGDEADFGEEPEPEEKPEAPKAKKKKGKAA